MTTAHTYGDSLWPERSTRIDTTSVLNASGLRSETMTYDAITGEVLTHAFSGWSGSATQPVAETHTTSTTLYGSNEVAPFNPGGAFNSAWMSLPQPANMRKSVDGPHADVNDVTTFVYYPIDGGVNALWRGRLAAVKNAAGHVVRYENYDVFGNPQRVVDANGMVTEATFDSLGRVLTSTLKGVTGCNTTVDPLCATDRLLEVATHLASIAIERRQFEATLRETDRVKDDFLATLSHELRTPLTAIMGWTDMLMDAHLSKEERHVALSTIRSSTKGRRVSSTMCSTSRGSPPARCASTGSRPTSR